MGIDGLLVMGLVVVYGGVVVVVMKWLRARRATIRARRPAVAPPLRIGHHDDGDETAWYIEARSGGPTVGIDILIYRPAGSNQVWASAPIDEPIPIEPGQKAKIASSRVASGVPYDVVLAWTSRHPSGDVQETQSVTVAPGEDVGVGQSAPATGPRGPGFALTLGAIGIVLALGALAVGLRFDRGGNPELIPVVEAQGGPITAPGDASTMKPPASSVAPTASSPPTPGTTVGDGTSSSPTATTVPVPDAAPDDRRVLISGRVEDCRFGPECVIASFRLEGFVGSGRYICEFEDGSRFDFGYLGTGASDACSSSGAEPSITIEVDGVRSDAITRQSPDGT